MVSREVVFWGRKMSLYKLLSFAFVLVLIAACGKENETKVQAGKKQKPVPTSTAPSPSNTGQFPVKNSNPQDVFEWQKEISSCNSFINTAVFVGAFVPFAPSESEVSGYCSCVFGLLSYSVETYANYKANKQGSADAIASYLKDTCDNASDGLVTSNLKTYIFK